MKVYVANYEPNRIGGGWTFARNFIKGMGDLITYDYNEADVYFITSPSMVLRENVERAWTDGKKIVLRIDNAVRNSRNRNTGMSRMYDFAQLAHLVIFQSHWAKNYLIPFLRSRKNLALAATILNGVDLDYYHDNHGERFQNILYSRFNRDETKNWEVARYWYSQHQLTHPNAKLYIAGQFSDDLRSANFDFYNNERFEFCGVLDETSLSRLYGVCELLYSYYNDACSNTLIEALVSGSKIVGDKYYRTTGGAPEIRRAFEINGREYFSLDRMCKQYIQEIGKVL